MTFDIHAVIERIRGLWPGMIGTGHDDRLLEIQHLEDELKRDTLTASERRQLNRKLCELKGIHFDDVE